MVPISKRGEKKNVMWRQQPCYYMKAKEGKKLEAKAKEEEKI